MAIGTNPKEFAGIDQGYGLPMGVVSVDTEAGTSTYKLFSGSPLPFPIRIVEVKGYMLGAGAASDTVKLTDGTNDITSTEDLSVLADTDAWDCSQIDNAYADLERGDTLQVETASDALTRVFVFFVRKGD